MPAVAFVPLTILWLGVGDTQKFAILFIGVFFQEVLLIMDNVKNVPRDLIQVSYTFGLSKWEVLRAVILPAALPGIWDTFRITLGWAWTYLVVAELVAANVGLGLPHHAGAALSRDRPDHPGHPGDRHPGAGHRHAVQVVLPPHVPLAGESDEARAMASPSWPSSGCGRSMTATSSAARWSPSRTCRWRSTTTSLSPWSVRRAAASPRC